MHSKTLIIAAGCVIVVALIAALAIAGAFTPLVHNAWFPWIIAGLVTALVVLLIIVTIFAGMPWYRERQFVRQLGAEYRVAGQQSPQELQAKFSAALREFRALPQYAAKGDPIYALPWFLLIGHGESGKTEAIKAAGIFSALTSAREGATQNFDAWVSTSMLLLDTTGRYAIPSDVERDRAEWYRLLRLIKYYRGREPLSGTIIAVAADYLASQPNDKLRTDAGHLRERIEDAIKVLSVNFPVYILVTKCDILDGFDEFVASLPIRVLNEALGFIDEPVNGMSVGPSRLHDGARRLHNGLDTVYQRLSTRAISVLSGKAVETLRRPLFCFPEEFRMLAARLEILLEVLCGEDVRYHTPLLRGVFFSSAHQHESRCSLLRQHVGIASQPSPAAAKADSHCFLRDVFEVILPRDRGLASAVVSKAA